MRSLPSRMRPVGGGRTLQGAVLRQVADRLHRAHRSLPERPLRILEGLDAGAGGLVDQAGLSPARELACDAHRSSPLSAPTPHRTERLGEARESPVADDTHGPRAAEIAMHDEPRRAWRNRTRGG